MMAKYNFEGDTDNISERQLEFINSVIQDLGYTNCKIVFETVGQAGDNYSASLKRIIIDGDHGSFRIVAKIAPTVEPVRSVLNTFMGFKNEHIMYTEVLPKLVQLQKNADIPEQEQLQYAKCYGSLSEPPNEILLFEDLTMSDFKMLDRFKPLSNDCIKSVLKNFAIYHSLSFVLRHKEPETFNNLTASLIDMWAIIGQVEEIKKYFQALEDDTLALLDNNEHINILRHKVTNALQLAVKWSKTDRNNKYTVITQGDAWTNNFMFRFEDEKLLDSILIDYQISKNTSPVYDIMYTIFNCTDYMSRKLNFHDWIDYYHSELEKSLSNFGLKANFVYPRDRLDADLKRYGKLAFGLSVILASILIRKTEDAAKVSEALRTGDGSENQENLIVSSLDGDSKTLYKRRVIELIESFIDLGLM